MAVDVNSKDGLIIRKLIPLSTLPEPRFQQLCSQISIQEMRNGVLFKKGDLDTDLIYLLSGEIVLQAEGLVVETISAGAPGAQFALAHQIPRKINAVAKGRIRYVRVNAEFVSDETEDSKKHSQIMDTEEIDDQEDWMTALLRLPIFQRLPPANLQKILISLESARYKKGEVIVEQGGRGDYYYLIKEGQCLLTRKPSPNAKEIKLAQLVPGDTFGEDALLSDAPRNVTITALTDMMLLRLGKDKFISLIKEPSLRFVSYSEALEAMKTGTVLVDVRYQDEYENRHLAGSINVPFFTLRMHLKTLSRDKPIIVICNNGKASEAAAFFLLKNKFNTLILKGGMEAVLPEMKQQEEHSAAQFAIDDGREIPIESIEPAFSQIPETHGEASEKKWAEAPIDDLKGQVKFLKSENEKLRTTVTQLNEKRLTLEQEKEELEKQCRILQKQLDKMTQVLDRIKK